MAFSNAERFEFKQALFDECIGNALAPVFREHDKVLQIAASAFVFHAARA